MNQHLRLSRRAAAALLVMLAVVLTACGPDTGSTNAAATTHSATATGTITNSGTRSAGGGTAAASPANSQSLRSATVSWQVPSTNSDGSELTNLAGFYIRYGTQPANLSQLVNISGTESNQYVVQHLTAGTWYFTISSYTTDGLESAPSAMVSETI
jgi:hypothetical protein